MGGLGGFLRDAGAFPRLFFHINMVKPKVNAFCYTKRKSWCVLFFPAHCIRRSSLYMRSLHKCIRLSSTSAYFLFIYTCRIHRPKRRKSAAALSAAVDTHNMQETAPNLQAEPPPKEPHPPNATRSSGEGVWGRGASLREAASPPAPPPTPPLREGARGRGLLAKKPPPSHLLYRHFASR